MARICPHTACPSRARHTRAATPALFAAALLLSSCVMFRGNPRTALPPRDVAPDTGVVIVGVRNYDHQEMVVFMESPNGRWRIGSVPGMHESLFVLPSTVMGPVRGFVIAVIPVGSQMQSYQTGFIQRTPGRVVVVGIEVGEVEPVPEVALPEA